MAVRVDGTDIVIDGWEKGISDDPYKGLNDMRGVNVISIPGEALVSFAQTSQAPSSVSGTISSVNTGTDVITASSITGTIANYTAVTFATTGSLPTGLVAATTYWINFQSSSTFKVYSDPYLTNLVDLTSAGSGTNTFTSINMTDIRYFEKNYGFALDSNGRCWSPTSNTSSNIYTYMGNSTSNASGNGLVVYKGSGTSLYLFVFRNGQIDYTVVGDIVNNSFTPPSWVTSWNPSTGGSGAGNILNTRNGVNNPHEALVGQDNAVYYVDGSYVGSFRERAGATFDPTSTSTYTFIQKALPLPLTDTAQCLEELGQTLLIGGKYNFIYPWDRVSTNFRYPLLISERGVVRLITVNTNCYIFAGKRGRIFVTNGSQAQLYKKVPDFILGVDPIFTFQGVGYNKNQIYFGISAKKNDGTVSSAYAGLWAIDITTDAMRVPTLQSTTTATVTGIWSTPNATSGFGLQVAWKTVDASDITQTVGIDSSTQAPYASYVSYIDTEILPVGQFLNKKTFNNLEFKLSAPLVSGESIKISARANIVASYTQVGETTLVGAISDAYTVNFDQSQWVQFRIEMKSTASTPSYVRLKEIRIRSI